MLVYMHHLARQLKDAAHQVKFTQPSRLANHDDASSSEKRGAVTHHPTPTSRLYNIYGYEVLATSFS